jgi:hypothetical protein
MHPLLQRLTGKSALKNWSAHLADIAAAQDRIRAACTPATTHAARLAQAIADFDANPSPEKCQAVIDLETQKPGVFFIEQRLRDATAARRLAGLVAGRDKFEAAVAEVRRELERRRVEIQEDDAKRSAETGEEVRSERALALVAQKLESLESALTWFANDPGRACAHLQTVIG